MDHWIDLFRNWLEINSNGGFRFNENDGMAIFFLQRFG
jgi:hypothetical protein